MIPELQTYLRGRLKNSKVSGDSAVSEPQKPFGGWSCREVPDDGTEESGADATER